MLEIAIFSRYITKKVQINLINHTLWVFTKAHSEHKIDILLVGY